MDRRHSAVGELRSVPRILVIEDDQSSREGLAWLLEDSGYSVEGVDDGKAALDALERFDPDLIITDLAMPSMSGFEVIQAVRARPERSDLPVITVSANDEIDQRVRSFDAGADDFVAKPIDFEELLARIRRQLQRANRQRVLQRESMADSLTGVLNRRGILTLLEHELAGVPSGHHVAVVMLDIDAFKPINDTYGHLAGDVALCAVARELEQSVRVTDSVSRLGGDEFLVVMPGADASALESVVERVRAAMPLAVTVSGTVHLRLTLSLGAVCARSGDTVESLLERADEAMYADKRRAKAG